MVRFADKNRHQLFIEPEGGEYTNEMYVGGMSSSLPEDVQYAMYRTVKGLEHVKIIRNAMPSSMIVSIPTSSSCPWSLRRSADFSAGDSSTEVPVMRRRRPRG